MSSQATISYKTAPNTNATINIYNLQGKMVQTYQANETSGNTSISINRGQLPAGTYMVELKTDKGSSISKKLLIY